MTFPKKTLKPSPKRIEDGGKDKLSGRMWEEAFALRRCLVLASCFYERVEICGRKVPLRFHRTKDEGIWIAGIWESDEEKGECFSMITTIPNGVLAPVHDPMPAVLADEQIEPFMEGELNAFGPSAVALKYLVAANFLTAGKPSKPPPIAQDELF